MSNLLRLNLNIHKVQMDKVKSEVNEKKLQDYKGDYEMFVRWCKASNLQIDFDSVEQYLLHIVTVEGRKLNTYNRKRAALKFYLENVHDLKQTDEQLNNLKLIRDLYKKENFIRKAQVTGVRSESKKDVMELINKYDNNKRVDIRKRAICLVNLITANRPSEMVRIKISDFDLDKHEVNVMLKKQGEMFVKQLTLECVQAIRKYINEFELKPDDYFVGRCNKYGNYSSQQLDENVYSKHIKRWLGFCPYTLRKTQVSSMYNNGASLPDIASQTGHKSLQTITEHYLTIEKKSIEKYL